MTGIVEQAAVQGLAVQGAAVRYICILAIGRTGSSHLTRLLNSCPEINCKSELFHHHAVATLSGEDMEALKQQSNGAIVDNATLCEWRITHVVQTLKTLYRSGGSKPVAFKVFPDHLEQERIQRAIFARDDVVYIVLRRRPIESFISSLKANKAGRYGRVDTTAIKPELSAPRFLKWSGRVRSWYAWIDSEIGSRNLPHFELGFERHLESASAPEALTTVLAALSAMGMPAIAPPRKIWAGERQDKEVRYQDRVSNWAEFEAEMKADPERAEVLAWAETAP